MTPRSLTVFLCCYLGLTVLGFHGSAALLPRFIDEWQLSATQAGWLLGVMSLCALVTSPLIALTDRIDARRMMIGGALVNVAAYAGFGLFAQGLGSAMFFRGLMGVGFVLTYMPGIKALGDRIGSEHQSRATSTYVSSFSICSSLSIAIAGLVAAQAGWRWAYAVPALTNLLAAALLLTLLAPAPVGRHAGQPGAATANAGGGLFGFGAILVNRPAIGFVAGGFSHSVELLAMRGWTVAFLTFVVSQHPGSGQGWNLSLVATLLILLGVPAGMVGGALGARYGLARVSVIVLLASGLVSMVVGFASAWPFWVFLLGPLVFHNVLVMADAGTLSAGVMSRADPQRRGSTVAFYTMCGSVGAFIGPVLVGTVLDATGGRLSGTAWGFAFASVGVIGVIAGLVLQRLARD